MGHPAEQLGPILFETTRDALFLVDVKQSRLVDANLAAVALVGLERKYLQDLSIQELMRTESGEPLPDGVFANAAGSGEKTSARLLLRSRREGEWVPTAVSLTALPPSPSSVVLLAVVDDRGQRDMELLMRTLIDSIPDLIFYKDRLGVFRGCNAAYEAYIGKAEKALVGTTELELFPREISERHLARDRKVMTTGNPLRSEEWLHYPDGGRILVEEVRTPLVGRDGQLWGLLGIARDITERRHLEEQLRHSQKMEAVGQLAGGVAHDFNNLLTVVLGNLSLLGSGTLDKPAMRELLEAAEKAGWRAAELVRQLLSFSRQTMLNPQPTDLNTVVEEIVAIVRRAFDPRIVLRSELQPDLWQASTDQNQMHQVLMNLCLNARDAMPEGGELLLTTANVVVDEDFAENHPDARPGEFVRLSVSDTGHGIAPEVLPRIFEPFFTTKELGQGTGLGLAIAFGIVKQHDGWIDCSSALGAGTRFDLYLPRLPKVADPPAEPASEAPVPGGTETILVVDDEAMIRDQCNIILRERGYRVLLAADGRDAERIYALAEPPVDLVLLDCVMPRLSGRETFQRLRALNPQVRVLLCSGYAAQDVVDATQVGGALGFIAKPYRAEELARAVRAALDERRTS